MGGSWFLPVGRVEFRKVAADVRFDLCHPALELGVGEVAVAAVDGLELASIDCHDRIREQIQLLTQDDELPADVANSLAVVLAEVRYRLEVGGQARCEPHQLDIALGLALEPAARLDTVQVTLDVELEQYSWVVGWPASICGHYPRKAHAREIKLIDEYIDHANRVIFGDVVIQVLGK